MDNKYNWLLDKERELKDKGIEESSLSDIFVACEMKPNWKYWANINDFCRVFKPAYIYGELVQLNKPPQPTFAISKVGDSEDSKLVFGYLLELTPAGLEFFDRLKGYNHIPGLNYHARILSHCWFSRLIAKTIWVYVLTPRLLGPDLIPIENGFWDHQDQELSDFVRSLALDRK